MEEKKDYVGTEGDLWQHGPLSELYEEKKYPNDGGLHGFFKSSDGNVYEYDTAPQEVLLRHGCVRGEDGIVRLAPAVTPPHMEG